MSKKLSILICSLESRAEKLSRLLRVLNPQVNDLVEIITSIDNGEKKIGSKRNELIQKAQGDYISFIDDDDLVSEDYVSKILEAIKSDPDCCGIQGVITFQGTSPRTFIHSLSYKTWFEKNEIYYRCPNHLNPVKRSIAIQVGFPEENFGEDRNYSERLLPLLKTEKFINGVLYKYLYEKGPAPGSSPPNPQSGPALYRKGRRIA
jgi:glycosyltransferase involved in cell wall biosynthesis